jgi:hypothetical protein
MKTFLKALKIVGLIGCFVSLLIAVSHDQYTKAIFFLILGKIYIDAF